MRVFVTGATGFVGSAVVQELLDAGHQVLGLARSDASAGALARVGVEAYRGDLSDAASLAAGTRACDGVIHTAFNHDYGDRSAVCEMDRRAIEALGAALAGSDRPLIATSGASIVTPGRLATEEDMPDASATERPRVASEEAARTVAARGVRVSVVRLPVVHGDGDHGFVPAVIRIAREQGVSAYVGDGRNRWPAVHRLDAAHLYRLALERGSADARYHAVAEEGVAFRDVADVIGRRLHMPIVATSPEAAANHFGWFAAFARLDGPASSGWTRETLGWQPKQSGLILDLDRSATYFDT